MNIYAKSAMLFLFTVSFNSIASLNCAGLTGCERTFCELEYKIEKAKESNNQYKIDGLKKALKAAKSNCSDEGIKRKLVEKIEESEQNLSEYRSDLNEAEQSGNQSKIKKYQEKIHKEKRKLESLSKELSELT